MQNGILTGGLTRRQALAAAGLAAASLALASPAAAFAADAEERPQSSSGAKRTRVSRLSGADRYATARAVAQSAFPSAEAVVLASGENFPDALGASALAGVLGAPVLITPPSSLHSETRAAVASMGARRAVVVGGEAAVGRGVVSSLRAMGLSVERVAGAARQQTACEVARRVAGASSPAAVIVASGSSYPDALSASPYAYAKGYPILLTEGDATLSAATLETIRSLGGVRRAVVVGGPSAVSPSAESALAAMGLAVERWAGADRYATSAAVARGAAADGASWARVGVASGENFPDALVGGAAVGQGGGVMLLTPPRDGRAAAASLAEHEPEVDQVLVLGGASAVTLTAEGHLIYDGLGEGRTWVVDTPAYDEQVWTCEAVEFADGHRCYTNDEVAEYQLKTMLSYRSVDVYETVHHDEVGHWE